MVRAKTWKQLVREVVADVPREFTLAEILAKRAVFEREYPDNKNVDAKIRQTLQILRDQGLLAFKERGRYERKDIADLGRLKYVVLLFKSSFLAYSPIVHEEDVSKMELRAEAARVNWIHRAFRASTTSV